MTRSAIVWVLMGAVGAFNVSAEEFPLTFHTLAAKDVVGFPGSYGTMGQLRLAKPAKLKSEPKALSRHPLYGECRETSGASTGGGFLFRLDESKGDGRGYDQLILDINRNGDLTDDVPAPVVVPVRDRKALVRPSREKLFGPIETPPDKLIAGGRPVYYAQVYVSDLQPLLRGGRAPQNVYAGSLRLKAAWYVDATVELKGVKQKVGLYDGDSNLRLGDVPRAQTYHSSGEEDRWYFDQGDAFLVDADGSGTFERDACETESCPFGPVLYVGATPYHVAVTADGSSLRVEPWTGGLAEVALQPHGNQVRRVTLAWERPDDQWQLIRAGVADGKVTVPSGNYRLYACELLAGSTARDQVIARGSQSIVKQPSRFAAGGANSLRCGAPLEIKVKAEKAKPESWELGRLGIQSRDSGSLSEYVLSINATVCGAGGEVYSEFGKGEKFEDDPPQPTFTIIDTGSKKVGDGKLEFG